MKHSRDTQGDALGYALLAFQAVRGILRIIKYYDYIF